MIDFFSGNELDFDKVNRMAQRLYDGFAFCQVDQKTKFDQLLILDGSYLGKVLMNA